MRINMMIIGILLLSGLLFAKSDPYVSSMFSKADCMIPQQGQFSYIISLWSAGSQYNVSQARWNEFSALDTTINSEYHAMDGCSDRACVTVHYLNLLSAINQAQMLYFRSAMEGITTNTPPGTSWISVMEQFMQMQNGLMDCFSGTSI